MIVPLTKGQAEELLGVPLTDLIARADRARSRVHGARFDVCTIMNAKSGRCTENCRFCAQSAHHATAVPVYGLKPAKEIVAAAAAAKGSGAGRFGIVTSGNRLTVEEIDLLCSVITEIVSSVGIAVCASLGALSLDELRRLKGAGLSRYHHNIETSERFYPSVVTTHSFAERLSTVRAAREAGLEVCSGGIIGMGESWEDRLSMAFVLRELGVVSVPLNFLVPVAGTPFGDRKPVGAHEAIRTICLFRLIVEKAVVKIAAGIETVLKDFQGLGFMAGANGMLMGGYLTVKGRGIEEDKALISEIVSVWNASKDM